MAGQRRSELTDDTLQSEIELVGDLVVAAAASSGRMSDEDIDRVLGVAPDDRKGGQGRSRKHPRSG